MANIVLKNIYKTYENSGIKAVTDFNLEIKDNEVVAFLGPSGCGRTTTLFMIAGLEAITKGELYIDGKLMNEVKPKDRSVAIVFQNYALFPYMTVFENIAFGLRPAIFPEDEIKEKVEKIARSMDIFHVLERKPDQISGGQRQRTALARALIQDKDIILLDQPLSNLDAKLRDCMRTELMKIHKEFKRTYIYVTHDQDEAMIIADKIVVMRDGMIQQIGTPEDLYLRPVNMFVAGFMGSPQMNFWKTKVVEENGDIFIDLNGVKIKLPENKADKAGAYIGKEVYAGIRPEDMFPIEFEPSADDFSHLAFIDADVQIREFLGDRSYLYCENGNITFTARVLALGDLAAKSGDKIKVGLHRDKIYLFDKDTELTIVN